MINQNHAILHYNMKRKCNCNGHSSHLLNMNMHIRLALHIPFKKYVFVLQLKCILLLEIYSIYFSCEMLLNYSNRVYQRKDILNKIGIHRQIAIPASITFMNIERFFLVRITALISNQTIIRIFCLIQKMF